ncbi:MAG: ribonuclease P protein component [Clostridia bacterium]|nr:ribonuclease P protein component [Clostridia bacterium]
MDFRLKTQKDFNLVFKQGKRLFSDSLTLLFFPSKQLKAGFAVGKKHGKSVQRNRIKRLLRESFRSFTPKLTQNFFFVFIPKVKNEYSLETYKKDMNYLFKKGGFFN